MENFVIGNITSNSILENLRDKLAKKENEEFINLYNKFSDIDIKSRENLTEFDPQSINKILYSVEKFSSFNFNKFIYSEFDLLDDLYPDSLNLKIFKNLLLKDLKGYLNIYSKKIEFESWESGMYSDTFSFMSEKSLNDFELLLLQVAQIQNSKYIWKLILKNNNQSVIQNATRSKPLSKYIDFDLLVSNLAKNNIDYSYVPDQHFYVRKNSRIQKILKILKS